jgi:hypothetical protein
MEPPKPTPRIDVRRNAENDELILGVHMQDGTYTAVFLFEADDDATLAGKFKAMADRIKPEPRPKR